MMSWIVGAFGEGRAGDRHGGGGGGGGWGGTCPPPGSEFRGDAPPEITIF